MDDALVSRPRKHRESIRLTKCTQEKKLRAATQKYFSRYGTVFAARGRRLPLAKSPINDQLLVHVDQIEIFHLWVKYQNVTYINVL